MHERVGLPHAVDGRGGEGAGQHLGGVGRDELAEAVQPVHAHDRKGVPRLLDPPAPVLAEGQVELGDPAHGPDLAVGDEPGGDAKGVVVAEVLVHGQQYAGVFAALHDPDRFGVAVGQWLLGQDVLAGRGQLVDRGLADLARDAHHGHVPALEAE